MNVHPHWGETPASSHAARVAQKLSELSGEEAAERLRADARAIARLAPGDPLSPGDVADGVRLLDIVVIWAATTAALAATGEGALSSVLSGGTAALAATLAGAALGLHRANRLAKFWRGWAGLAGLAALAASLLALAGLGSGETVAAVGALAAVALAPHRALAAALVRWARRAGAFERRAVVVGGGAQAERVLRALEARQDIRVVGLFDDRDDGRSPPLVAGRRKLGRIEDLVAFARVAHVDLAIVTFPPDAERRIRDVLRQLAVLPIDVRLSAVSERLAFTPERIAPFAGADLLRRPLEDRGRRAKRLLDLTVGLFAIVALSPVMLAAALAIRLDSPGPVFFRQRRHGYNHRAVDVLKFRTMRHEAADPEARVIVTRDDPRVTRVGRFLRKTSIDELPQLFTVLGGSMSLVGPRPHALAAKSSEGRAFAEIVEGYSARHRIKPGVTGWAQINGWRGEIEAPEALRARYEHDLWYIENWSIWLDLKILARTPPALLDTRRAY